MAPGRAWCAWRTSGPDGAGDPVGAGLSGHSTLTGLTGLAGLASFAAIAAIAITTVATGLTGCAWFAVAHLAHLLDRLRAHDRNSLAALRLHQLHFAGP